MIVVKLEIWPFGMEEYAETIGVMEIHNDATGTLTQGNYEYNLKGKSNHLMKSGRIESYPRKAYNTWNLIRLALEDWRGK